MRGQNWRTRLHGSNPFFIVNVQYVAIIHFAMCRRRVVTSGSRRFQLNLNWNLTKLVLNPFTVGLRLNPPFCLITEKKFSRASWFNFAVVTSSSPESISFIIDQIDNKNPSKYVGRLPFFWLSHSWSDTPYAAAPWISYYYHKDGHLFFTAKHIKNIIYKLNEVRSRASGWQCELSCGATRTDCGGDRQTKYLLE